MVVGEDMAGRNRSEAFSFDTPSSELVVDGHIEGVLGWRSFGEGVASIGVKGNHAFSCDKSPE